VSGATRDARFAHAIGPIADSVRPPVEHSPLVNAKWR
jgi:hypothetical protein